MTGGVSSITELPLDILVLVFPYLDAKSFLSLCGTCKAFQQPSISLHHAYWSHATQDKFRVQNRPTVVQNDGIHWQKMYKRLLTQSRVFTWGSNKHHRLGHSYIKGASPRRRIGEPDRILCCANPIEMELTRELGVVADQQCGGSSTTILTSSGTLYMAGVLDGLNLDRSSASNDGLQVLQFPVGYPKSAAAASYDEPSVAIRQFSAGTSHVLGLSDNGRIWSWSDAQKPGMKIKFLNVDLKDESFKIPTAARTTLHGRAKQVVAGHKCSSAYIYDTGIVLWEPVSCADCDDEADTMLVFETAEVPKTGYRRLTRAARESDCARTLGEEVGEVKSYIVLERFVIFITDIGKVFCAKPGPKHKVKDILELRALRHQKNPSSDVQGSYRLFALLKDGEVIVASQDYLDACWAARSTNPKQTGISVPNMIPALQNNHVVSMAFGDRHFLALHSNGKITSYGLEPQSCGALGLGRYPENRLRGLLCNHVRYGTELLPNACTRGRQIWFREEQHRWLTFLSNGGKEPEEAEARRQLSFLHPYDEEISDWVEQESTAFDSDTGEDGLGPFFALSVSAAGCHSSAIVLVNEELAGKQTTYDWSNKSFPRLKLSDGTEMVGSGPFDEWREGRPER